MHSTWSAPGDVDEPGDVTMQLAREADTDAEREPSSDEVPLAQSVRRRRRRRSASMDDDAAVDDDTSSGADEPAEAAPGAVERTLDEALQRAVRGDAQLRRRILQLEPVAFDEVLSVATRAGVRFKKKDSVRDWLDAVSAHASEGASASARASPDATPTAAGHLLLLSRAHRRTQPALSSAAHGSVHKADSSSTPNSYCNPTNAFRSLVHCASWCQPTQSSQHALSLRTMRSAPWPVTAHAQPADGASLRSLQTTHETLQPAPCRSLDRSAPCREPVPPGCPAPSLSTCSTAMPAAAASA
jgi:hypothetical protein